jgi:hypothetical protein
MHRNTEFLWFKHRISDLFSTLERYGVLVYFFCVPVALAVVHSSALYCKIFTTKAAGKGILKPQIYRVQQEAAI